MADDKSYEVGYGRPPKHSQFQKGRSGNPKGRPKWKRTEAEIVARIRDEPVALMLNGQSVRVSMFEALLRRAYISALNKGSVRDCENLIHLSYRFGAAPAEVEAERSRAAADAVMAKMLDIFDKTVPDDDEK